MSKVQINDRCPLQSECGRKKCEHKFCERDCSYYQGNASPGAEIEDQQQAMEAEWEARMNTTSVLADTSALAAQQEPEPVVVQENNGLLVLLPVDRLHPHPDNPRKELGDLTELAGSIKANGVFQNLTVVPDDPTNSYTSFTVIIGHRRLAAAKLAGLTEVPCVVTMMTDKEQLQTMLLENMQRADLTVYEQAQGFQMMLDMGETVESIAEGCGISQTTVRRRVRLLDLNIDDNTDYPTFKAMVDQQIAAAPEYTLLVCAYASVDEDENSYWGWEWNSQIGSYEYKHNPNDKLDRLYDFLVSLGYEMSDEEKAMRDGTHQLLNREDA